MATILTKKKDTTGAPGAGDLTNSTGGAELAVNTADKRLYTKDSGGNVVEVGINPTSITTGTLNTSGQVVFNDAGADVDFRVEGDTDANLLFVDASADKVGIGTNAPSGKLHVYGANELLRLQRNSITSNNYVLYKTETGADQAYLGFSDGGVSDFAIYNVANGYIRFGTNNAERARITSGGYFKASDSGTYQGVGNSYHELRNTLTNNNALVVSHNAASPYGQIILFDGATPNNTTNYFLQCEDTTNTKLFIYSSGTVTNRTGTYNSISDLKLKQDITDASSQWDDIKALRIVKYRLKDEVAADPNYPAYIGVIAQEVEQVSPGLVEESPDFKNVEVPVLDDEGNPVLNEDGTPQVTTERQATGTVTKAVKYSIIYMKAVKALQEAMERIETLEAKVAALEAK